MQLCAYQSQIKQKQQYYYWQQTEAWILISIDSLGEWLEASDKTRLVIYWWWVQLSTKSRCWVAKLQKNFAIISSVWWILTSEFFKDKIHFPNGNIQLTLPKRVWIGHPIYIASPPFSREWRIKMEKNKSQLLHQ